MKKVLVVTSISRPSKILESLAQGARTSNTEFILAGDTKSPQNFSLNGCYFLSFERQVKIGFRLAAACPTQHYARKNIGYLMAIQRGAQLIIETDDDNWPQPAFFSDRPRRVRAPGLADTGWVNVYRYFSDAVIWPRGLPLDAIHSPLPAYESLEITEHDCPIQQGLADENPDVDAVYRLALPLPQRFRTDRRIALAPGAYCPFNSQNTAWWPVAFPLLYLPSFCSFRMTDIWRSLVAQRIAARNDWRILFHGPTVWQERNEHDLMKDFEDEVPGYLNNRRIVAALETLSLRAGVENLGENLRICYEKLVELEMVPEEELTLVDAWLADLGAMKTSSPGGHTHVVVPEV